MILVSNYTMISVKIKMGLLVTIMLMKINVRYLIHQHRYTRLQKYVRLGMNPDFNLMVQISIVMTRQVVSFPVSYIGRMIQLMLAIVSLKFSSRAVQHLNKMMTNLGQTFCKLTSHNYPNVNGTTSQLKQTRSFLWIKSNVITTSELALQTRLKTLNFAGVGTFEPVILLAYKNRVRVSNQITDVSATIKHTISILIQHQQ